MNIGTTPHDSSHDQPRRRVSAQEMAPTRKDSRRASQTMSALALDDEGVVHLFVGVEDEVLVTLAHVMALWLTAPGS